MCAQAAAKKAAAAASAAEHCELPEHSAAVAELISKPLGDYHGMAGTNDLRKVRHPPSPPAL